MKKEKSIIIIGGVAGGASAAARLRRLDETAKITLIERGPDVSFANCGLPYHIGGEISDRSKLALQTPQSLQAQLNIDVLVNTEATSIERERKAVHIVREGVSETLPYDKLILSPGASPLKPPLPGIDLPNIYALRNLQDMDRIKTVAQKARRVIVIGAGFIGLEMAEQLIELNKEVYLVELADQVLPQMDAQMTRAVEQELMNRGVKLILSDGIQGFEAKGDAILAHLNSGKNLEGDFVVLSIGVRPESSLAKQASLDLGERGHIKTNPYMQTSDPDIYAVGDVCEGIDPILGGPSAIPLGGPANRQGRCAADHIVMGDQALPYPGSIGTAIVRVFDIAAGVTGHSEKRLQQMGIDYEKTIVTDYNHASYFPGATHLTVKILWEKSTGRLLGGQACGYEGVDKRLDVLATAIKGNLTVEAIAQLELAYAPPFGSAKDPINIAGFSATNIRQNLVEPIYDLENQADAQIIDIRPAEMAALKPIPGARNIPLTTLRDNLQSIDKSKPVVTVCALGKTSYFASRILRQHGFNARSHVGGWKIAAPLSEPNQDSNTSQTLPMTPSTQAESTITRVDATGMACPGPIMRVKAAASELPEGGILEVSASDSGFLKDFPAFCNANGFECLDVRNEKGIVTGRLRKGSDHASPSNNAPANTNGSTIVVFSGELDRAMAAFVIANGAIAMGGQATLFFTFWGLNVLRKETSLKVSGKSFMDKMFGFMLPKGPSKLPLSNMHMGGMGTAMMKNRMASKDLPNLPDLMKSAIENNVRLVACTMSMEAMGIKQEELIDGVELGGVAEYLDSARSTHANLFI